MAKGDIVTKTVELSSSGSTVTQDISFAEDTKITEMRIYVNTFDNADSGHIVWLKDDGSEFGAREFPDFAGSLLSTTGTQSNILNANFVVTGGNNDLRVLIDGSGTYTFFFAGIVVS